MHCFFNSFLQSKTSKVHFARYDLPALSVLKQALAAFRTVFGLENALPAIKTHFKTDI